MFDGDGWCGCGDGAVVVGISTACCHFSLFYHCSWFSPLQTLAFYDVNIATKKLVDY